MARNQDILVLSRNPNDGFRAIDCLVCDVTVLDAMVMEEAGTHTLTTFILKPNWTRGWSWSYKRDVVFGSVTGA